MIIINDESYVINGTRNFEPDILRLPLNAKNALGVEDGNIIQNSRLPDVFEKSTIYHNLNGDKFPEKAPAMEESLEIFAKQLREGQTDETAEVSYRRQQVEAFREMQTVSVKQIELLQMLEEPVTWNHLKAAEEFRQNLTKAFMKIKKEADKYNNSYENVFQAAASELEEQFNSRDEAVAAYKALAETEKQILDNAIYENDDITSLDVKELGLIYKQISFTATLFSLPLNKK